MAYSREQKAEAIVQSAFSTDQEAADACGTSRRSVQRWRSAMDTDPELAQIVARKWKEYREADNWAEDATETIRKALGFIRQAVEHMDPSDPEAVTAITGAIQTLANAKLTADVINARLAEQNQRDRKASGQNVAGRIGTRRTG